MKISATTKISDVLIQESNIDIKNRILEQLCAEIAIKILKHFENHITNSPNKEYGIDYSLELNVFTDKELQDLLKRSEND